jgi:uncharacterized protein YqgV (UPF0045/DUF77 family)
MIVTAELSFYPLNEDYVKRVLAFIARLQRHSDLAIQTSAMSTQLTGSYDRVMEVLNDEMLESLEEEDCVFVLKIARAVRA